jgi:hypothetical protein
MNIPRLVYEPTLALDFYQESLGALGALCERTWHDRLDIVAEGRAATLWNPEGALHAQELVFAPADVPGARDAAREVFPGCPLTFRIAELLSPAPAVLDKFVMCAQANPPEATVLEKLWRSQYPATRYWRLGSALKPVSHLSLVGVVRCEIQAIDQRWSLHRIAISLPDGEPDEVLAQQLFLLEPDPAPAAIDWRLPPDWWHRFQAAVQAELEPDLQLVRARQEQYLQRELQRIDAYFAEYQADLARRTRRSGPEAADKVQQRLAAAQAEHSRRRQDQVMRHEIRVKPHLDALLWVAEQAWEAAIELDHERARRTATAIFVPRIRRWFLITGATSNASQI